MATKTDLTGAKIGRLTVLHEVFGHECAGKHRKWAVVCECGNQREMFQQRLKAGTTLSCGCLQRDKHIERLTTHGMSRTPVHVAWQAMLARCSNKSNPMWHHYGGRGISVCAQWKSFENFLADMGDLPFKGAELDRIDNDGNYEPGNCRWATRQEQMRNTRQNVFVEVDGVSKTVAEWSVLSGIPDRTLHHRAHRGLAGSAFLAPPRCGGVA